MNHRPASGHTEVLRAVAFVLIALALAAPAFAVDFIRGDANSDGVLTISDAYASLSVLFLGRENLECSSAGDANVDGSLNIADPVYSLTNLFLGGQPLLAPYPSAGPDPTPDSISCETYGNGAPLEDPVAKLEIASAVATGGGSRRAIITLNYSSTGKLAGYSGIIRDTAGVIDTKSMRIKDMIANFDAGFRRVHDDLGPGLIEFGVIISLTEAKEAPAGQDSALAEIRVCLKPGTPAGEYPIELQAAELIASCFDGTTGACSDSGRAIHPTLVSGTLIVENDVTGNDCTLIDPPPINIRFSLEERSGQPGGNVTVPFNIRADRASQGFSYSVHFDEAVLAATGTDKIFQTSSGSPYEFERFEENNETGFVVGAAIISLSDTGDVLPPSVDMRVLEFDFAIDSLATVGETELEFRDGGRGTGGPVLNKLIAGGQDITPDAASSFVFVNGRINIVPDGIPFVRGNSNGDAGVNLSDAVFTLNYLFLGAEEPACADAADANDDGGLDIADPVTTLNWLFSGTASIPPPFGAPGPDPTADGLGCGEGA